MRPLFVENLSTEEIETLKEGLRSSSAFTVRRSQILLKSYAGQKPQAIGQALECSDQTVRMAIRAYKEEGLACLREKSHARHDQMPLIDAEGCTRLEELVRLSPRTLDHASSVWTRPMLAQQLLKEGYVATKVSATTISNALGRAGISWRRAKKWILSPDAQYERRKKDETN